MSVGPSTIGFGFVLCKAKCTDWTSATSLRRSDGSSANSATRHPDPRGSDGLGRVDNRREQAQQDSEVDMIDGIPLIDAHVHAGRLSSLNPAVREWAASFQAEVPLKRLYDGAGDLVPDRFEAYLRSEGVEMAILVPEYSPKVTGIQAVEDLFPLLEYNPTLFRLMANLNPHLHDPIAAELDRQIELGAVGLKIHPVHGGFAPNDIALYPAYTLC